MALFLQFKIRIEIEMNCFAPWSLLESFLINFIQLFNQNENENEKKYIKKNKKINNKFKAKQLMLFIRLSLLLLCQVGYFVSLIPKRFEESEKKGKRETISNNFSRTNN